MKIKNILEDYNNIWEGKYGEQIELYSIEQIKKMLYEFNVNGLKGGAENKVINRAREHNLGTHYQEVTEEGEIIYKTTSATTPGVDYWEQKIKLLDFDDAIEISQDMDIDDKDVVNLMVFGDLEVKCDCPAFLYWGYKYIAWELDYGIEQENRPPDIRNPNRDGTVCKHLYNVFTVLPAHILRIASDLREMGIL